MQWFKWIKQNKNLFQILKCICLLKKEGMRGAILYIAKDIVKQLINKWNQMILIHLAHIYSIFRCKPFIWFGNE